MNRARYLRVLQGSIFVCVPFPLKPVMLPLVFRLEEASFTVDGSTFAITCVRGSFAREADPAIDSNGMYEAAMSSKFTDCLKKLKGNSAFIDVGGGTGYYSILASQLLPPRNIHAFEPEILAWNLFQLNNRKYCQGDIRANRQYIGNKNGKDMITLDEYCLRNGVTPGLVKMDIEGYEYYAIDGMLEVLKRYSPMLLIEFHERLLRENFLVDAGQVREAIAKIEKMGYAVQYNGHHYYANTHQGIPQEDWTDKPTNNVNYAMFCYPV
jgi:hypothetical protein